MKIVNNKAEGLKIAYIGGGSRGWAWGLMSDLARAEDMSGEMYLYDIDFQAAKNNEIIGNKIKELPDCRSPWNYKAAETIGEALKGADFVVISILPGTFDEMESDIHTPEKYGIYQSVGDTSGPGGIIRSMRTIPMMQEIALAVKEYCPDAWVINYTNPMTVSVRTLCRTFPEIKVFGCCHEVFGTQKILKCALEDILGIKDTTRDEMKVNVIGVNHFTWVTDAKYKDIDLLEVYDKFVDKYYEDGYIENIDNNWMNNSFASAQRVKFDLYKRFGVIAAAGDRHLAEFCPGDWYLKSPEQVTSWKFGLTKIDWRRNNLAERLEKSAKLVSGEIPFTIEMTGEEGVNQMRALLGLSELVTNVNIPNRGQIPNLPIGAVVETNAVFRADGVTPVFAGEIPAEIYPLISRIATEQEIIVEAGIKRDLELAFSAFTIDPLVRLSIDDARKLFDEMVENTKNYLGDYLK